LFFFISTGSAEALVR